MTCVKRSNDDTGVVTFEAENSDKSAEEATSLSLSSTDMVAESLGSGRQSRRSASRTRAYDLSTRDVPHAEQNTKRPHTPTFTDSPKCGRRCYNKTTPSPFTRGFRVSPPSQCRITNFSALSLI